MGYRDGSVAKNTHWLLFKSTGVQSQQPLGGLSPSPTPIPEDLIQFPVPTWPLISNPIPVPGDPAPFSKLKKH